MLKRFSFILIALASALWVGAIEPTWNVELKTIFDNREGHSDITAADTYFFANLAGEVGLRFSPTDRIAGGVYWFQPVGTKWQKHHVSPTLYYRHDGPRWRFSMGMFPRRELLEQLPDYLWNDSLSYCQNNIRGALVQYVHPRGFAEAYLDWRGLRSKTTREAFNIVFHGQRALYGDWLGVGGYAQMNHYALNRDAPEAQHIVDNFLVNPYVAADLTKKTPLDSLEVRAGLLMTVERNRERPDSRWDTPKGLSLLVVGEYRRFGVKNHLYIGQPLFPSYNALSPEFVPGEDGQPEVVVAPLGPKLYQGEPYYQKRFYDRLDLYYSFYKTAT